MPAEQQEEVTYFKARTHHGSGRKDAYVLEACVYLEDPKPSSSRAIEVPRQMKLSVLRWDEAEATPPNTTPEREANQAPQKDSTDRAGGVHGTNGHRDDRVSPSQPHVPDWTACHGSSCPNTDGCQAREALWMLCNLDDHLLFSQFHLSSPALPADAKASSSSGPGQSSPAAPPPPPPTAAPAALAALAPKPSGVTCSLNGDKLASSTSLDKGRGETKDEAALATAVDTLGAGAAAGPPRCSPPPVSWRGWHGTREADGENVTTGEQQQPRLQPPEPRFVRRSRRDERVTFHARPTCHDFTSPAPRGVHAAASDVKSSESRSAGVEGRASNGLHGTAKADPASRSPADGNGRGASGAGQEVPPAGAAKAGPVAIERFKTTGRMVAVGFKSGECAVLDATVTNSPSFVSVLNKGGAHCEGRVAAVRFVPGAGYRLLVAAFSTGDAYTFDVSLSQEAPMGPAAEKAAAEAAGRGGGAPAINGAGGASNGNGVGTSKKRGLSSRMGSGSAVRQAKAGQDGASDASGGSIGSSGGGGGSSGGGSWGRRRSAHGAARSPSAPPLPASFTRASSAGHPATGAGGNGGASVTAGGPAKAAVTNGRGRASGSRRESLAGRRFSVERNGVEGANPVSRWIVSSDGRELTDMAFAPCQVKGRRLVALAALDGVVRVVDYDRESLLAGFRSWFGGILCLDWSPDARYIVVGGEDDAVTMWCLETRACVLRGEGHGSWVTDVAFDTWSCRSPYYRFTSVGEDARLCMWEHDETAGKLLRSGAGTLRDVSPPDIDRSAKVLDDAEDSSGHGNSRATASPSSPAASSTPSTDPRSSGEVSVGYPDHTKTWPIPGRTRIGGGYPSARTLQIQRRDRPHGGPPGGAPTAGRRPSTTPNRGISFFGGSASRRDAVGVGDSSAGEPGHVQSVTESSAEGVRGRKGGGDDKATENGEAQLVFPPLLRRLTPRSEPLCCKRLADVPLHQVMVVREGIVTLCADGLLKMWARPYVPPPLPVSSQTGDHRMEGADPTKSPAVACVEAAAQAHGALRVDGSVPSSSRVPPRGSRPVPSSIAETNTVTAAAAAPVPHAQSAGASSREQKSGGMASPPALDALINNEMRTPKADGGATAAAGATGGGPGSKKRLFPKKFFQGGEKNVSAGKAGSGSGSGSSKRGEDEYALSALSAANAKARDPADLLADARKSGAAAGGREDADGRASVGTTSRDKRAGGGGMGRRGGQGYGRRGAR